MNTTKDKRPWWVLTERTKNKNWTAVNVHVGVLKAVEDLFEDANKWGYELYPSFSSFVGDAIRRRIEEIRNSYPRLQKKRPEL